MAYLRYEIRYVFIKVWSRNESIENDQPSLHHYLNASIIINDHFKVNVWRFTKAYPVQMKYNSKIKSDTFSNAEQRLLFIISQEENS